MPRSPKADGWAWATRFALKAPIKRNRVLRTRRRWRHQPTMSPTPTASMRSRTRGDRPAPSWKVPYTQPGAPPIPRHPSSTCPDPPHPNPTHPNPTHRDSVSEPRSTGRCDVRVTPRQAGNRPARRRKRIRARARRTPAALRRWRRSPRPAASSKPHARRCRSRHLRSRQSHNQRSRRQRRQASRQHTGPSPYTASSTVGVRLRPLSRVRSRARPHRLRPRLRRCRRLHRHRRRAHVRRDLQPRPHLRPGL